MEVRGTTQPSETGYKVLSDMSSGFPSTTEELPFPPRIHNTHPHAHMHIQTCTHMCTCTHMHICEHTCYLGLPTQVFPGACLSTTLLSTQHPEES